jgi:hypothetical protein
MRGSTRWCCTEGAKECVAQLQFGKEEEEKKVGAMERVRWVRVRGV